MKTKRTDEPITRAELQKELARVRAAVIYLANCLGANVLSADDAERLSSLLRSDDRP